jgi:hypothetical protein
VEVTQTHHSATGSSQVHFALEDILIKKKKNRCGVELQMVTVF